MTGILHKPLSSISVADDPAITAENYPGLIYGINAASVSANGLSLTSVLGGVVQGLAGDPFVVDAGGEFFTTPSAYLPTSPSGVIPGPDYTTDKVLALYVGGLFNDTQKASIGDSDNVAGFSFSTAANAYITRDATNYHTLPNQTKTGFAGAYGVQAVVVDLANNTGAVHSLDSAGLEVDATVATLTLAGAWGNIAGAAQTKLILPPSQRIYGMYLFYLSALPTDAEIAAILGWTYANPSRLYPGLAGRA